MHFFRRYIVLWVFAFPSGPLASLAESQGPPINAPEASPTDAPVFQVQPPRQNFEDSEAAPTDSPSWGTRSPITPPAAPTPLSRPDRELPAGFRREAIRQMSQVANSGSCIYADNINSSEEILPTLISAPACATGAKENLTGSIVCLASITCSRFQLGGGTRIFFSNVACKPANGRICPSANDCLLRSVSTVPFFSIGSIGSGESNDINFSIPSSNPSTNRSGGTN